MKMFIGIIGCVHYAKRGDHQACRDTFLKNLPADVDYRFFIGDGTPSTEDNEQAIQESCGGHDRKRGVNYGDKCRDNAAIVKKPFLIKRAKDEVILPVEDDFAHLPIKLKHMIRWALANGFDYFFRADSDTYVDLPRLMTCGFEKHEVMAHPTFGGGCGWVLNRASMEKLAYHPVSSFIDEVWAMGCLRGNPIEFDLRFSDDDVMKENDIISTHVGFMSGYTPQRMYDLHTRFTR